MSESPYRVPSYLSPSGLACWERNPDEYFMRYIVPKSLAPARDPQTSPMAVGSAFDALVKAHIFKLFFGLSKANEEAYLIRDLVNLQCEPHTLPDALVIASDVFEQYRASGALGNLIDVIRRSTVAPKMEFTVQGTIGGVPMLGKPDLHFNTNLHREVIADWKVSGSVSKAGVSPQQGYQLALDVWPKSRTNGMAHKKYAPVLHESGLWVSGWKMNESTYYWADQLSTYAWALGHAVGDEGWVARIEQLACRPGPADNPTGQLRVKCVTHQSTVDSSYQWDLLERYKRCWSHVSKCHYWPELSLTESQARGNLIMFQLRGGTQALTPDTLPEINW
ncbi:MAG: hypothetical protein GY906_04830 [bacterium]|nr:hypothetical protein [bacterium]